MAQARLALPGCRLSEDIVHGTGAIGRVTGETQACAVLWATDELERFDTSVSALARQHGYLIEPTIFEATNDMAIAQEEIFGPVLTVFRWNDFDQMIREADDVRYGLAAGVYTSNLKNAMATADRLEADSVWINAYFNLAAGSPFGA